MSLNDEEAQALTGERDLTKAMKILLGWGLKLVNITLGKDGAWLARAGEGMVLRRNLFTS